MKIDIALPIGQKVFSLGQFDGPTIPKEVPVLASFECRFRLPDGRLEETVIPFEDVATLTKSFEASVTVAQSTDGVLKFSQKENGP